MPVTIADVRQKYPQYSDMSDGQLADALHGKFYSDMPKQEFYSKIGLNPETTFSSRLKTNFSERDEQALKIATQAVDGDISTPEALIRSGLKFAQIPFDTVGREIISPLAKGAFNATAAPIVKQGFSDVNSYFTNPPQDSMVSNAIQGVKNFQQDYPVASGRIGSAFDIGNIAAPFAPIFKGENTINAVLDTVKPPLSSAGKITANVLTPNIDPTTLKLAQKAQDFDIPLKLSQISSSKPAKILNAVTEQLPFSGSQGFEQEQQAAFNKAVAKTIGQDASNLGPETINAFRLSNAKKYKEALGNHDISFTGDFGEGIDSIVLKARKSIDPGLYSVVKGNAEQLKKDISEGIISAEKVNSIRSELLDTSANADSSIKNYLSAMIDHIDDAVSDSLPANNVNALKQASREWRNYRTLEPLLEKSVDGNISPALINQRVASSKYIKASRSEIGKDDLVDLGRIGQKFLKQQVPDSGSAQRIAYMKGLLQGGGTAGAAYASLPLTAVGLASGRGLQALNRNQSLVKKTLKINEIKNLPPKEAMKILEEMSKK